MGRKRLIEGARNRGIPVLFGPMAYMEEDYADKELQRRSGINRIMSRRKCSWRAVGAPTSIPSSDRGRTRSYFLPHKGIDVFETDLPGRLERMGTTHLVIPG